METKTKYIQTGYRYLRLLWLVVIVWFVVAAAGFAMRYQKMSGRVQAVIQSVNQQQVQSPAQGDEYSKQLDEIKKRGPFSPPPGKPAMPQCSSIIGDSALFNGKLYKIGETVSGAEILEINAATVKIKWQDHEQTLQPFGLEVGVSPSPGMPDKPHDQVNRREQAVDVQPEETRRRGGFGRMSAQERDRMRQRYQSMSEQERREQRERYMNASPEERQKMREEFRNGG